LLNAIIFRLAEKIMRKPSRILGMLIVLSAYPVSASEQITVQKVLQHLESEQFRSRGSAPYLEMSKDEIEVKAFPAAARFRKDGAKLSLTNDKSEPVKQIDFVITVCNAAGADNTKLQASLEPIFQEKSVLLKEALKKAIHALWNVALPDSYVSDARSGEIYRMPSALITYYEGVTYCDANGGRVARFTIKTRKH
jgi:hypothetical protein